MNTIIVDARPRHVGLIHEMIEELADHLGLAHEVVVTEDHLRQALFGERPQSEVVLAYEHDVPAGFALFYGNYSTFRGRCGIHLEDLYVRPAFRGAGLGRALLRHLAALTLERGCGRLEWWVLGTDERAAAFYQRMGASAKDEWTVYRLRGEALSRLAGL
jgi:GNAT superfamily N-acetyltransferase